MKGSWDIKMLKILIVFFSMIFFNGLLKTMEFNFNNRDWFEDPSWNIEQKTIKKKFLTQEDFELKIYQEINPQEEITDSKTFKDKAFEFKKNKKITKKNFKINSCDFYSEFIEYLKKNKKIDVLQLSKVDVGSFFRVNKELFKNFSLLSSGEKLINILFYALSLELDKSILDQSDEFFHLNVKLNHQYTVALGTRDKYPFEERNFEYPFFFIFILLKILASSININRFSNCILCNKPIKIGVFTLKSHFKSVHQGLDANVKENYTLNSYSIFNEIMKNELNDLSMNSLCNEFEGKICQN